MKGDVKILSEGFARLQDEVKELKEDCMCIYQRLLRAVLIFVCGDVWGRNKTKQKQKKEGKGKRHQLFFLHQTIAAKNAV